MREPGEVLDARRAFFSTGRIPPRLIATPIARSWQRCAQRGLRADVLPRLEPMTSTELRVIAEPHAALRRLARPEMEMLRHEARDTGGIVILTDPQGLILDAAGDLDFAGRAARVALRPGVPWDEGACGTNAIGTALVEHRVLTVHGAEHYFEPHHILTCTAAPVIGPRGDLAGTLDLSGPAGLPPLHARGLVQLAVAQIEHRAFEQDFGAFEILRLHPDPALLGTPWEGVLVFEQGCLIAANRCALRMLDLDWDALGRRSYSELFRSGRESIERRGQVERNGGRGTLQARRQAPTGASAVAVRAMPPPSTLPAVVWSEALLRQSGRAQHLLDAGVPLLLSGETGTGKEILARQIHRGSARAGAAFVAINCAAIPEGLIEAELFGYEEGAFSGARRGGRRGLLREAGGGVLFLDEIGDMPLALQARLLRVLQAREVRPVGGEREYPVDFALVCASHRDLRQAVAAGRFREDLYYRIAQYTIELPPLRAQSPQTRRDIIQSMWRSLDPVGSLALDAGCLQILSACSWPGNYRQLAATVRAVHALAVAEGASSVDQLPTDVRAAVEPDADSQMQRTVRETMRRVLDAEAGNVSRAARRLGISRSTLYRHLRPRRED